MNKYYDPVKIKLTDKIHVFYQPYGYGRFIAKKLRNESLKDRDIKVIAVRKKEVKNK